MYEPVVAPPVIPPPPPPVEQKQSIMGIISLVLAVIASIIMCVDVALIAGITGGTNIIPETRLLDAGLSCIAAIIAITGLGLGIAAVIQKNTKRVFPILGLVFNGLYLLGYCGLVAINLFNIAGGL
jgi:hypothetical protein